MDFKPPMAQLKALGYRGRGREYLLKTKYLIIGIGYFLAPKVDKMIAQNT